MRTLFRGRRRIRNTSWKRAFPSAAGYGRFEFGAGGLLYLSGNPYLSWRVLPDTAAPVFGRKAYDTFSDREYPVVVSPDQDWVAFALPAPGGASFDLWVSRLRYQDPVSNQRQDLEE